MPFEVDDFGCPTEVVVAVAEARASEVGEVIKLPVVEARDGVDVADTVDRVAEVLVTIVAIGAGG
jgi:hypothetical protein